MTHHSPPLPPSPCSPPLRDGSGWRPWSTSPPPFFSHLQISVTSSCSLPLMFSSFHVSNMSSSQMSYKTYLSPHHTHSVWSGSKLSGWSGPRFDSTWHQELYLIFFFFKFSIQKNQNAFFSVRKLQHMYWLCIRVTISEQPHLVVEQQVWVQANLTSRSTSVLTQRFFSGLIAACREHKVPGQKTQGPEHAFQTLQPGEPTDTDMVKLSGLSFFSSVNLTHRMNLTLSCLSSPTYNSEAVSRDQWVTDLSHKDVSAGL